MPKVILSGNLNLYGNAGQFETDRSTWGFADIGPPFFSYVVTRSSVEKSAGLYSALVTKPSISESIIIPGRFPMTLGKKYLISCKVRIPSSNPLLTDGDITLNTSGSNIMAGCTVLENNPVSAASASDAWQEVSLAVQCTNGIYAFANSILNYTGSGIINGLIYVDQFEIYEYEDGEDPDPDPDPECDVEIDPDATDVVNETSEGAADGSIDLEASGADVEYSKDGTTWQLASLFSGLTTGIYIIRVRKQALLTCLHEYPFAVNHAAVSHDFTPLVTNESVSGLHDGAISIDVTGTGGPFEYSIDAGGSWQSGNLFSGLAPGVYYVAVRNADGNSVVKVVTVGVGTIEYDTIFHSKNPIVFNKAASDGWEEEINYRLYNEVRVEDAADSGIYNTKLKVALPPDAGGEVNFYIAEAFRGVLSFAPPTLNQNTIVRLTDRIKRFRNYSGELIGTETSTEDLTPSAANIVVYGGIDKFHWPGLKYFTDYLSAKKKFLTWAPIEKYVDRTQEDYLNFFVYGNFNELKLQIKAYFDDATDDTGVTFVRNGVVNSQLYQIPAGPVNCGVMTIDPLKNVTKYELCLLDQTNTVITEVRTYHIVRVRHPRTRFFMFLNSLGSFEVLRFTGQASIKTGFDREVVQRFLPHDYNRLDGEFSLNSVSRQKQASYGSGYQTGRLAAQWHEYLEDFVGSPVVYDVTSGSRQPVTIISGEHIVEDQNYQRFIRVEARPSYDNTSFTPVKI